MPESDPNPSQRLKPKWSSLGPRGGSGFVAPWPLGDVEGRGAGGGSTRAPTPNPCPSFNSGLNTFGLNNSYATTGGGVASLGGAGRNGGGGAGGGGGGYGRSREVPGWLGKFGLKSIRLRFIIAEL